MIPRKFLTIGAFTMNRIRPAYLFISVVLATSCVSVSSPPPTHSAVTPVPRKDKGWVDRHESFNKRAAQGNVDLIFIGDSITQGWEGGGKEVWAKYYAPRKAMNLGISGDQTQHVLWRLDNGNLEGISPKAAVIMIGTNNHQANSAREIADGIEAIVKKLRAKLPKMKIVILAIFPRGEKPNEDRTKLAEASAIVSKMADGKKIFYLDIGKNFLGPDETISKEIMPDFLHLTPKGYEIWASSIEPTVKQVLGEK